MDRSDIPLIKDRKILKRVDASAARRSLAGLLASCAVFALLAIWGELYAEHETMTLVCTLAIIISTGFRLLLVIRFDSIYGAGPARWRRLYGLGLLLHSSLWGSLTAALLQFYGLGTLYVISLIYIAGMSSALSNAWMGSLKIRQLYPCLMFIPSMIILMSQYSPENALITVLLFMYMVFLMQLYKEHYLGFWHSVQRDRRPASVSRQKIETAKQPKMQLNLVYRLAHEIRTPMNSVMGMLSLLRDTPLTDEQKEFRQVAAQSGKLLLTMIDDVLDYSRILGGRINLNPEYFDLRTALEEMLDAYGPAAQSKGLELNAVIDRHLPTRVRGDSDRIVQIISNLISNAIKFSDKGDVLVRVSHEINGPKPEVYFQVADDGAGMDAQTASELFHDVLMDDEADVFSAKRTGFGLLVCKGLVEAMGGRIWVESTLDVGTTFHVRLPLESRGEIRATDHLQNALNKKAALLCGCSDGTVQALSAELESLEMSCHATQDYDHALQVLRERHREQCDVLLLIVDTHERNKSALDLCRTVLSDPALEQVKVILQTSISERAEPSIQALLKQFANLDVLVKPAHRRALRILLEKSQGLETLVPVDDKLPNQDLAKKQRQVFRLMLVEDNEVNQIVTKGMLDRLGYQVKTVSGGQDALALFDREAFDLILMDCMMPEMDGFETTRRLRDTEKDRGQLSHVPIIAMTANTVEGAQARCLAAGMDDYLAKPVHLDDLDNMLATWLPLSDSETTTDDDEVGNDHSDDDNEASK